MTLGLDIKIETDAVLVVFWRESTGKLFHLQAPATRKALRRGVY